MKGVLRQKRCIGSKGLHSWQATLMDKNTSNRTSLVAQWVKKEFICNTGSPGEGNGNPLQYSCWRIPWTEEPGRLQLMGCKESDTNERLNFQFSSVAQLCPTLCNPMDCSTPGLPVHHQLLELAQIHVYRVGDDIQLSHPCHPLLLPPSIFPSIRVFSNESVLPIRWPKYWSFSFSISTAKEYSGLISFRTDWLDLLAVQGILKSLLQHHSSKASNLQHSAFFIVQLSYPYITPGKTIVLPRQTLSAK